MEALAAEAGEEMMARGRAEMGEKTKQIRKREGSVRHCNACAAAEIKKKERLNCYRRSHHYVSIFCKMTLHFQERHFVKKHSFSELVDGVIRL